MPVGAAKAGDVDAGKVQRLNVLPVTEKITKGELEGYHGEGPETAQKIAWKVGGEPATATSTTPKKFSRFLVMSTGE